MAVATSTVETETHVRARSFGGISKLINAILVQISSSVSVVVVVVVIVIVLMAIIHDWLLRQRCIDSKYLPFETAMHIMKYHLAQIMTTMTAAASTTTENYVGRSVDRQAKVFLAI